MTRKRSSARPPRLDPEPTGLAPRALGADEQAAWEGLAQATRPLRRDRLARPHPVHAPSLIRAAAGRQPTTLPELPRTASGDPFAATLDRRWDERLARGEVLPEMIIDLHGASLQQAHGRLVRGLARAHARSARLVLVITGKGSAPDPRPLPPDAYRGVLRDALPDWLMEPALRAHIAAARPAHQRHGGTGATYLILKRARG